MRLLSWDVGIINLSYCLIEYDNSDKSNPVWKIIDWAIINLTDREKIKCFQCGANPSLMQQIVGKDIIYTCKNHMKNINTSPASFDDYCIPVMCGTNCQFVGKKQCEKMIIYTFPKGDDVHYYCSTHAKSEYKKLEKSLELKIYKKQAVRDINLDELRLKLIRTLDDKPLLLTATQVLIENQPSLKNPRMKSISSTIYDFYLIRGIVDKEITKSEINLVKYMCPSNKLKLASDGDSQKLVKLKGQEAKTYKLTKALGIKYCAELISSNKEVKEKWLDHFNSYKKKDDMADSFLQGIYYVYN
jgi:hypothetical protein